MPFRAPALAIVLLGLGCAPKPATTTATTTPPAHEDPAPAPAPAVDCGPAVRSAAAIAGPGAVVLVGEMHGTVQVPEAVGRIACHAALRPEGLVILGLEIATNDQPAVDAYLASDGTEPAVAALLRASHFTSDMKDGRSSKAMQQLLESVRRWRAAGAPIEVVCFDAIPNSYTTSAERDATMAKNLVAAHGAHPGATLVVLSGNIHNRTVPGVPWDAKYVPMGVHLREAFPSLVSLDFRSAGGTFWACMGSPGGETRCGVAQSQGEDRGPSPFVERLDARDDKGFDGVLYVGTTSASEPAVPAPASE